VEFHLSMVMASEEEVRYIKEEMVKIAGGQTGI
jgi:hypothetical protein